MSREITNKLLEMVDEGILEARTLALACLKYMSEDEVADMAKANEFLEEEEETEEEEEELEEKDTPKSSAKESYPYLVNTGKTKDNLSPFVAYPNKKDAVKGAEKLLDFFKFTEVVYMPEDDVDTNEVVWRSWKR